MSKEDKLTYLFDEIGGIDDSFVNEAMIIERKRSVLRTFIRTAAVAAVIVVITLMSTLAVAGFAVINVLSDYYDRQDLPESTTTTLKENDPYPEDPTESEEESTLKLLIGEMDTEGFEQLSVTDGNNELLFDGNARFIWTNDGSVYYSVKVSRSADITAIEDYLASDKHFIRTEDPVDDDFRFWISFGNGRTTSPFLENNAGGESFGELSDYVPEVYPSNEFAEFIAELIEGT